MSMKEVERAKVIKALVDKRIKPATAALQLGLTTRQVQRLANRFRDAGPAGLISAQRGKTGNRQLKPGLAQRALQLIRERYADFPPTFACEKLVKCHDVVLSKETVRRLMIEDGLWAPRRARAGVLHQPRERRACLGELVQIDGSRHDWFEGRAAQCALLVYVDDATGRLLQLYFAETETTASYFEATRRYFGRYGKPLAFYADKAAVFRSPSQNRHIPTQLQRAFDELDIELICANSAQAKGRVERMNRTLQERLTRELRLANISSIEQANTWCDAFVAQFNERFGRPAHSPIDAHRPLRKSEDLSMILAHRVQRKLSAKLTLQFESKCFVLADSPAARAHAGTKVDLYTFANGRMEVWAEGRLFPHTIHEYSPAKAGPIDVDTKTIGNALDQLTHKRRRNRNPTASEIAAGVTAAKQASARKVVSSSVQRS
ncbi:MAG: ISNCY family transposase [Oxalobacteraceae bacterium]|nr:MAG: ISNCY family transposase [Oxalobacteraceae bacterium]